MNAEHDTHEAIRITPEMRDCDLAFEYLAKVLHDKMEQLDPSDPPSDWRAISSAEKQFYRSCIDRILLERDSLALLTCERTRDHSVGGRKVG
jgi:hypothetical protein